MVMPPQLSSAQSLRSVFSHAGHDHAHAVASEFFRHAAEEHISRGTMAVDSAAHRSEHDHVPERHALDLEVTAARADQGPPRQ